jgi:uroporphyrinogen-III decarboxylase
MFGLEYEAFGVRFPGRHSWDGLTGAAKERQVGACIDIREKTVERYQWDALLAFWLWCAPNGVLAAKNALGEDPLTGGVVCGSIWEIESVGDWTEFAADLAEHPAAPHEEARRRSAAACGKISALAEAGADFTHLINDVALNSGTVISPPQFRELCDPYLAERVAHIDALSAVYCLEHGAPGGGYIFGASNTIFPGMPLEHWEYVFSVYREFRASRGQEWCQ